LKAYAQNSVKIISGDKQRIEAFCELNDLTNQLDQAVEEKDTRKAEELSEKGEELLRKLGPEFAALAAGINSVNLSSQDAREIGSIIGNLNEYCNAAQQSALSPRL
jgi:ABC-type transporter Mla subunit MlaD